eukprot:CAMPEP_0198350084 /NCGR_PEP_ID=MMETSP1450-20131203/97355_1 /TAXON_ID=753684 ORGANISM="Madagascaria erythrocladiodes, Strain CCMP3234" /NCGR_SAMPLE_ID=MMETSP1450 /ASSEMBLY_ACC=CAM_ASM_001115 /LENGTH=191 /DNA_ID=CAMNT_0044055841 /DNA_START=53 /DNA_END=625 /DNA_ORIENTATION=-
MARWCLTDTKLAFSVHVDVAKKWLDDPPGQLLLRSGARGDHDVRAVHMTVLPPGTDSAGDSRYGPIEVVTPGRDVIASYSTACRQAGIATNQLTLIRVGTRVWTNEHCQEWAYAPVSPLGDAFDVVNDNTIQVPTVRQRDSSFDLISVMFLLPDGFTWNFHLPSSAEFRVVNHANTLCVRTRRGTHSRHAV